ncbi:hypothetical protein DT019_33450 [Streptomyces sp. SDr-06]|nr:hypothetical protein DT019_33450 [Streptomyces sp. SDr-06]
MAGHERSTLVVGLNGPRPLRGAAWRRRARDTGRGRGPATRPRPGGATAPIWRRSPINGFRLKADHELHTSPLHPGFDGLSCPCFSSSGTRRPLMIIRSGTTDLQPSRPRRRTGG